MYRLLVISTLVSKQLGDDLHLHTSGIQVAGKEGAADPVVSVPSSARMVGHVYASAVLDTASVSFSAGKIVWKLLYYLTSLPAQR